MPPDFASMHHITWHSSVGAARVRCIAVTALGTQKRLQCPLFNKQSVETPMLMTHTMNM